MKKTTEKISRVLTAVLAAFMLISTAAVAANPALIDENATGSITIHKFDNTGTAEDAKNDGTVISDTSELGNPIGGISFTVTLIPGTVNATVTEALDYIEDAQSLIQVSKITNGSGVAAFTGLDQGIYLVQEDPNAGVEVASVPFLVSLPMTDPSDTSKWLYDVNVYPKNTLREITIAMNILDDEETPVSAIVSDVGDTVEWVITASIPASIASINLEDNGFFFIADVLDSRLDHVSTKVQLVDAEGEVMHTFTHGIDFTLTQPEAESAGGTVKVDFNNSAGIAKLTDALRNAYSIMITVETEINNAALVDLAIEIENTASLYYANMGGDTEAPATATVEADAIPAIELSGIAIYKWHSEDSVNKPLANAEFTIYASDEDAKAGTAIKSSGEDFSLTTDETGYIYFSSALLKTSLGVDFNSEDNFYLVETKAPTGFELLNTIVETTLGSTEEVENRKLDKTEGGFELPATGGTGTVLYTLIGLSLIVAALVIFTASKRKECKDK